MMIEEANNAIGGIFRNVMCAGAILSCVVILAIVLI